jgi:hypothetical protein
MLLTCFFVVVLCMGSVARILEGETIWYGTCNTEEIMFVDQAVL